MNMSTPPDYILMNITETSTESYLQIADVVKAKKR